ncbi:CRISPR system precrRNA processing endoribonuclease RAMP protein Cas6 [Frankia sp. CiP3]|uniref:CRISPR system precrRNA processing endoribonuclease RAMP protein Cas6 n=1 Tax=Frankia sp. CiP3 TaxID=2880971 RepID=UPI001EF636A8|nr:CRISPR system precrRNA processing endoribonuclease RAMP protein Cas6 [Frankia sp. CiP3]
MPARIIVNIAPTTAGALPPPHTGPAVNAAVLAAIRDGLSPQTSTYLHDGPPPRPFAITPLLDERQRTPDRTSQHVRFEVGVLLDDMTGPILAALAARDQWRIGATDYTKRSVDLLEATPYPDLLATAAPATSWKFTLITPVSFATGREDGARRQRILPDPERVFGTLAARWRTWAPETPLPPDIDNTIDDHLELVDMRLTTTEHMIKPGAPYRRGCVGFVRYVLAEPAAVPPETRSAVNALARFARYAGIGDRTASGMGYTLTEADERLTRGRHHPSPAA